MAILNNAGKEGEAGEDRQRSTSLRPFHPTSSDLEAHTANHTQRVIVISRLCDEAGDSNYRVTVIQAGDCTMHCGHF